MPRDVGTVLKVIDRMRAVHNFLYADDISNYRAFLNPQNLFYLVDDVGIICIVPKPEGYGEAHITFWDKRLRGRHELCRHIADQVLKHNGFSCLATVIPKNRQSVLAFAKRIGFAPVASDDDVVVLKYTPRS